MFNYQQVCFENDDQECPIVESEWERETLHMFYNAIAMRDILWLPSDEKTIIHGKN